jgi:hypothetical protein
MKRVGARAVLATIKRMLRKTKEPACTCAGDEDAPYGGHKLRCPRYGRRPL